MRNSLKVLHDWTQFFFAEFKFHEVRKLHVFRQHNKYIPFSTLPGDPMWDTVSSPVPFGIPESGSGKSHYTVSTLREVSKATLLNVSRLAFSEQDHPHLEQDLGPRESVKVKGGLLGDRINLLPLMAGFRQSSGAFYHDRVLWDVLRKVNQSFCGTHQLMQVR